MVVYYNFPCFAYVLVNLVLANVIFSVSLRLLRHHPSPPIKALITNAEAAVPKARTVMKIATDGCTVVVAFIKVDELD